MIDTKFTPGPWTVDERSTDKTILSDSDWIAIPQNNSQRSANAKLIAHAPEMFERLERARTILSGLTSYRMGVAAEVRAIDELLAEITK